MITGLYSLTIFLSAFLLFQVQPMMAKIILPWFGGTPAVWSTCLLFFQTTLLAGYAYAHGITALKPKSRATIHLGLLAFSLVFLSILPTQEWKPDGAQSPIPLILTLLCVTVGLPYFVLSTTGPLIQSWFGIKRPGASPYRLYSLSNIGSFLALLSYPFLFEPAFASQQQTALWSYLYWGFAILCGAAAVTIYSVQKVSVVDQDVQVSAEQDKPTLTHWLLWFGLSMSGSILLLAITNHVCHDVAVVPFIWVIPLSLYLLTFILCFESDRWYMRRAFLPLLGLLMLLICDNKIAGVEANILVAIVVSFLTLFVGCMVCHGELTKIKPAPRYLTGFYLMISAGGAAGGIFVGLIAPYIFTAFYELHIGLLLCAGLVLAVLYLDEECPLHHGNNPRMWAGLIGGYVLLCFALSINAYRLASGANVQTRNFYGVLRLVEENKDDPAKHRFIQHNGRIIHGFQYTDPAKRYLPNAYFGPESGVGLAFRLFRSDHPRRIGVFGLGVGLMAAYGSEGDHFRLYEINPAVIKQAREAFTYLEHSAADIHVLLGDARLTLEREENQKFDLLVLDAFSGDAVPIHLLTAEAFELYAKHLSPGGLLAVHVTNAHLDLRPVVAKGAASIGRKAVLILSEADQDNGLHASTWMLLASDQDFFSLPEVERRITERHEDFPDIRIWTDRYSNLFEILK